MIFVTKSKKEKMAMYLFYMATFSENMKQRRKALGLTQPQLAEQVDLSQKQISDYELGKTAPSIEGLITISKVFGISVDELIGAKKMTTDQKPVNGNGFRHGNSRSAKLLDLFDQLSAEEQRTTLKQIRGIIADKQRR